MSKQNLSWWRTALGEYPTGVALVTAHDEEAKPVGMIVGSFAVVSEEPPMVGFFPADQSRSFASIEARGAFTVSVLGLQHEDLSREFIVNPNTRFQRGDWVSGSLGNLRLSDAIVWFDCAIKGIYPAGDHRFVLADVEEFGVGSANPPLLYRRGGYGTFSVTNDEPDYHDFTRRVDISVRMREAVVSLAEKYDLRCALSTIAGSSVVVIASSESGNTGASSGMAWTSFPFAAPLTPAIAAYVSPELHKKWLENSRHLVGSINRAKLQELLETVRARGYAVSLGSTMAERFNVVVRDPNSSHAELAALWADVNEELLAFENSETWFSEVTSIQVPVFEKDGTAQMELVVSGFSPEMDRDRYEQVLSEALLTAEELSRINRQG